MRLPKPTRLTSDCAVLIALVALLIVPELAVAATAGGGLPYEGPLNQLRASVTGPVATTVSLIGIVGGFAALIFGGDMSGFLRTIVFVVLTVAVLVGANNFMTMFGGSGAVIAHGLNSVIAATV